MPKRSVITEAQVGLSRSIAFVFGGAEFHLRYRAGAISPAIVDRVSAINKGQANQDDEAANEVLAEFIYRAVRWWDVEEDDGTATPLTREAVRDIEPDFLMTAFEAIVNDILPGEASAAPSNSISS